VVFAQLVQRRLEWQNFEVTLVDPKLIHVQDASIDSYEKLDFPRERVVEMALGRDHLVVATASQCFIYSVTNWNTPHIFDLRAAPQLLVLAENYFLTLESTNMVTVYTYEGRQVSTPRFNGLRPESLNANTVALSNDCVAILDRTDSKTVRCFDVVTGRQLPDTVSHKTEIVQLALSQSEPTLQERRLSIIDRNSDLFITPVVKQPGIFRGMYKLQTQVDTMAWCDTSDMLCAVADGRFVTW
jgi:intraflagellar transport protein 80